LIFLRDIKLDLKIKKYYYLLFLIILFILFLLKYKYIEFFFLTKNFFIDEISFSLVLLTVWLTILSFISIICNKINQEFFIKMLSILIFLLIMCFLVKNFLIFYVFFEIILVPIFLIIYFWGGQIERSQAGIYILIYTIFGSLPLLYMLVFINSKFSLIFFYSQIYFFKLERYSIIFIIIAFLVKLPLYRFHLWLPKAHVEAPVAGSIILAGVLLKLGGYGLYRLFTLVNWKSFLFLENFLVSFRLVGSLIIGLICLFQIDVKILIAYSSVCHIGLVVGGLLSGSYWGEIGVLLIILGHGLCSSALFCIANFYYERFFIRNLILLKGIMLIFPSLGLFWFLCCIYNIGAPPSINLLSEVFLLGSLIKWSLILIFILVFISFLRGFYSLYLFRVTQHGKIVFLVGVKSVRILEYNLINFHLLPLLLYLFKIELFFFL